LKEKNAGNRRKRTIHYTPVKIEKQRYFESPSDRDCSDNIMDYSPEGLNLTRKINQRKVIRFEYKENYCSTSSSGDDEEYCVQKETSLQNLLDRISKEKSTAKKRKYYYDEDGEKETICIEKNIDKPERQFEYNNIVSQRRKELHKLRNQVGSDYKIQTSRISNLKKRIKQMISNVSKELEEDR